jgi:hypothetical protein
VIEIIGTAPDGIDAAIRTVWHERRRPHEDATDSTSNRFLGTSTTAPSHTFQTTVNAKNDQNWNRHAMATSAVTMLRCEGNVKKIKDILSRHGWR